MVNLFFLNLTTLNLEEIFFKKILEKVLKEKEGNFSLGLILVGQDRIRKINKRYRSKNQITEVLSFPENEVRKSTKKDLQFIEPKEEKNKKEKNLGEILLCPSRIKKVSQREKKDFKKELAFAFVHGLLHLLGYEHKDTASTKKMRLKEKEIMEKLDIL